MDFDLCGSEICLAENAPIRLQSARGVRVTCTAGVVWLTVEGEAGDIFLRAGQVYVVRGRGLALLEAIEHGRVRFAREPSSLRSWLRSRGQRLLRATRVVSRLSVHAGVRPGASTAR